MITLQFSICSCLSVLCACAQWVYHSLLRMCNYVIYIYCHCHCSLVAKPETVNGTHDKLSSSVSGLALALVHEG